MLKYYKFSSYSTFGSKFTNKAEKNKFDLIVNDIKHYDEFIDEGALEGGIEESPPPPPPEAKPPPPNPEPKSPFSLDENGQSILNGNGKPISPPPPLNINNPTLKKYHLSKTISTNFSIKQEFKDEVSKSYLRFIVKYICGGGKRGTLFGDALGTIDDNLYYIYKNLRLEGQAYAMTVDNFWRLCYDAHVNL